MTPLLVDSSAWIAFFTASSESKTVTLIKQAQEEKRLATCGLIYLEVLRGSRNQKEYEEFKEEFQAMIWLPIEENTWQAATQIAFDLGKRGIHPPATDLLIATLTMTQKCQLLHQDKHFIQISKYFPLRNLSPEILP